MIIYTSDGVTVIVDDDPHDNSPSSFFQLNSYRVSRDLYRVSRDL